mgnify:CR=1 FL=1
MKDLHKLILDPLVKFVFSEQDMYDKARSDAWIRKISKDDLDISISCPSGVLISSFFISL